jgi:mitofilin
LNSKAASPTPSTPSASTIPPQNVPLTPPPPGKTTSGSPPPPSPPPPKPKRRLRKFFTTLLLLSTLGFGGGVYYSRVNDNFHDFFTEYVPFGEEAVLYFEEKEFRKRFPTIGNRIRPRDTGEQVRIPSQSGVSWRVSEDTSSSRHANATKPGQKPAEAVAKAESDHSKAPTEAPAKPNHPVAKEAAPAQKSPEAVAFVAPEVDQPSRFPPEVTRIDPINIEDAKEPLVQDLVKIINDIIAVVNADNENSKFSTTIGKAKDEISKVGSKVKSLKAAIEEEANAKVQASHAEFDKAAQELVKRIESEMASQEARWKEEYETERQKLQQTYEQKLKAEIDRANEVNEQRLRNELLEQAVEMRRKFTAEVKDRVEEERNSRLGKLSDLSNTVNELEKLTTDWNSVVDANLKTQHLHVAVEAVRANLEKSQVPRPFTKELAALKEIASDDPVVNAAIASINPVAYQRGIPSPAQLIDRFRRVASEVRKASLLPEDAGVASHASSLVLSKLLFKKKGLALGNDVESILTRTEVLLEEGDLDGAAREMNGLSGWAKTLSRDWLGEVRKVLEVQQALDVSPLPNSFCEDSGIMTNL